jgi:hypothetical protein
MSPLFKKIGAVPRISSKSGLRFSRMAFHTRSDKVSPPDSQGFKDARLGRDLSIDSPSGKVTDNVLDGISGVE